MVTDKHRLTLYMLQGLALIHSHDDLEQAYGMKYYVNTTTFTELIQLRHINITPKTILWKKLLQYNKHDPQYRNLGY